ncbi:MAG: DUF4139 domain-containing protein [Deltaproteobacteria bacterium]|nr:DUF4139 domain-containing protein [Deltaproteobacteria bacterium]
MGAAAVLESRIREVMVFRNDAVVTREAELSAAGWPGQVEIPGLPLALDDCSVRARVVRAKDPGKSAPGEDRTPALPQPTDVRVELSLPPLGAPVEAPSDAELRQARVAVASLEQQIGRLDEESGHFDRISLGLPERLEDEPPRAVSAAAWSGVASWVERAKQSRAQEKGGLRRRLQEAREQLARLERQAREAKAERGVDEEAIAKRAVIHLNSGPAGVAAKLLIEYRVPGARWRPSYVLRVARDGKRASLAVRALVAQHSGEPWERVQLAVSTADLQRAVRLPELRSIRIGRSQPEPPARAWREPPSGAEALFESLDAALETLSAPVPALGVRKPGLGGKATKAGEPLPPPQPPRAPMRPQPAARPAAEWQIAAEIEEELEGYTGAGDTPAEAVSLSTMADESVADFKAELAAPAKMEMKRKRVAPRGAARSSVMSAAMPAAAPMATQGSVSGVDKLRQSLVAPASALSRSEAPEYELSALAEDAAPGGGGYPDQYETPRAGSATELLARRMTVRETVFDYGELRLIRWDAGAGERGTLQRRGLHDVLTALSASQAAQVERRLARAALQALVIDDFPGNTSDVAAASGAFDYRYDAAAPVDVPNDGKLHGVPLFCHESTVGLNLVVVPRETDQAVRVASMKNPLQAPVLAGPADIYLGDEFLVTSQLKTVPAGAELNIGLGIEPALKVARNTRFREETQGLLSGQLALQHEVDIELASRLPAPAQVEVRERIPVKSEDDKEVAVHPGKPTPPWEEWQQTAEQALRGGRRWRLTLAPGESKKIQYTYTIQIDSKNELVGGNRRE